MLRIMEAIQRKRLIQKLNDEYQQELDHNLAEGTANAIAVSELLKSNAAKGINDKMADSPSSQNCKKISFCPTLTMREVADKVDQKVQEKKKFMAFISYLDSKFTVLQKKALKITWRRLSEAPRTSKKGMLFIMQKIFDNLIEANPEISNIFYKSAFLSCIEDRRKIASQSKSNSPFDENEGKHKLKNIVTIRDHAQILLEFVNTSVCALFDIPYNGTQMTPTSLGCQHSRLIALGFDRNWLHQLGEIFAEVMFSQECVRAFPHAPAAWSLFCVTFTDRFFVETRWKNASTKICSEYVPRPFPTSFSLQSMSSLNHSNYNNSSSLQSNKKKKCLRQKSSKGLSTVSMNTITLKDKSCV
uniref:DUF4485 domain-containing protein n=1 Tax=Rhabditophanes sp. KR3021 TaxID=114890 RepID=A0AC35TNF5_9BILA